MPLAHCLTYPLAVYRIHLSSLLQSHSIGVSAAVFAPSSDDQAARALNGRQNIYTLNDCGERVQRRRGGTV